MEGSEYVIDRIVANWFKGGDLSLEIRSDVSGHHLSIRML